MDQTTDSVTCAIRGSVLVAVLDSPPVNALNVRLRAGILDALDRAAADATVRAVLLVGAGKHFIAGADIREFGKAAMAPSLPEVCNRIEGFDKIVVVAIHGAALGGGLEVALSAHYRIALQGARLGLPEAALGLIPGAGGTQRLPRLIGMTAALEVMLDGKVLDARPALDAGLVDHLGGGADIVEEGLAYVAALLDAAAPPRRTRDADGLRDAGNSRMTLAVARSETQRKSPHLVSPLKVIEAVAAGLAESFDIGLQVERRLFLECMESPQRKALVHAFFAEREVSKAPETRTGRPRTVQRVGVIGAGTMGSGIATALLDAGFPVVVIEREQTALDRGRAHIERTFDGLVGKGRLTPGERMARLARLSGSTAYEALSEADLVIEAAYEDMDVKHAVFAELDRVCKPGAVLATNTSYLDINRIAARTSRPQDVIGLHFFSPANVMKLVEVVVPDAVDADVVATGFSLAKRLGKIAVRAGICDGFIGNRVLGAYRAAAEHLMEDGASPYRIDAAVRNFGFAMGPFQVADLAGGDIAWATRKRRAATRGPDERYVRIGDALCERGWFGQKSGRGYYRYPDGARRGVPDPEVEAIIDAERARAGVTPRVFSDEDIMRRYLAAMINEGANVVLDGIAQRPLDVDVTFVAGYGFPRFRGGPMYYADTVGLPTILADIQEFASDSGREGDRFWTPSPLLVDLANLERTFDSLNRIAGPADA